jgi:type IX secretion system PorP/SprF family membrane protein
MNYKKLILYSIFWVAFDLEAQDFHFSQFYASPLTLNPALTGRFNGDYRLGAIHRSQWSGIQSNSFLYQTPGVSSEFNFFNQKASLGVLAINDQTNDKTFNTFLGGISFGYKILFERLQLSFGIQGTYSTTYLDRNKITQGALQIEPTTFENIENFDFNSGIFANYNFEDENILYFGVAVNHLLSPNDNFVIKARDNKLPIKIIFHSGSEIILNDKIKLIPGFLFAFQANASESNLGGTINYKLTDKSENNLFLNFGIWSRFNYLKAESFIPKFGLEYSNLRLLFSYDYNITNIQNATNISNNKTPNTFEVSLNIIIQRNKVKEYEDCYIFNPRF